MKHIIVKLYRASLYSLDGFVAAWRKELAVRLEVMATLLALPVIYFLSASKFEKLILILLLLLLLAAELLNTAIEAVVDRVSSDSHPLSKLAKDTASAAVAVVVAMNLIAWAVVLF